MQANPLRSAGSRDSSLTNHGVLQARRLGAHLAARCSVIGPITHIFTSDLKRAFHTAEAVADAQRGMAPVLGGPKPDPKVAAIPELREKDFGSAEGVKYGSRSGSGTVRSDSETTEAMMVRVNRFIDHSLEPQLELHASKHITIAVVAHGIILGVLLRALETRFPAKPPLGPPETQSDPGAQASSFWSNTGVLQAKIERVPSDVQSKIDEMTAPGKPAPAAPRRPPQFSMTVQLINNKDHLDGLKKTKGGIGSAQFDSRQRTMTSFFAPTAKKRKADDDGH